MPETHFSSDGGQSLPPPSIRRERDLAIGCFASIGRDRLSDGLLAFSRQWPQVTLGVQELPRGALIAAIREGALALAVLPGPVQAGLQAVPLWYEQVVVAMAADHPLARYDQITPAQLHDEVLLIPREPHRSDVHRFLSHRILPLGPPLNGIVTELTHAKLMERVATGDAITLLCAGDADRPENVVTRAIAAPFASFPIHACWRTPLGDELVPSLVSTLIALSDPSAGA